MYYNASDFENAGMPIRTHYRASGPRRASSNSEGEILRFLAKRVRELRCRRGMTRKMAARDANVSERHLAQLETGDGNVSILLLRRIAAALGVSLLELFSTELEEPAEKQLIQRLLKRLPARRLEEVIAKLRRELNQEENARRTRVAMIGLRGAGKSTLASRWSQETNFPFVELDREIEKDTGIPLAEIFSLYGQAGYRAIEKRALERVLRESDRLVVSVGGGVVSEEETFDYLLFHCYTVWIKAQPEEHMSRVMAQGDFRAMKGNNQAMDDLRRILEAREPLYRKADMCLDTSGLSIEESFSQLKAALQENLQ
jgi:XRE family transcriptional regulator, aerobic/anaerobic benzoate catabolism transcriptional regulator